MKFIFPILVWLCCSATALAAHPKGQPPQGGFAPIAGVTVGGGNGFITGPNIGHGVAPTLELSGFWKMHKLFFGFGSVGIKPVFCQNTNGVVPYGELGVHFFVLNLAAGYGVGIGEQPMPHHLFNLFVGVAIPLYTPNKNRLLYLEPYYRPSFALSDDGGPLHEAGLMLKWLLVLKNRDKN